MKGAAVIRFPSSAVGDYLKAIWELAGAEAASTKDVAARLSVSPASVSNMFVRLQEMGFVEYERYRGASLTGRGRAEALRRSEEHTSELQSRQYLVCRLLLEKKKKI